MTDPNRKNDFGHYKVSNRNLWYFGTIMILERVPGGLIVTDGDRTYRSKSKKASPNGKPFFDYFL